MKKDKMYRWNVKCSLDATVLAVDEQQAEDTAIDVVIKSLKSEMAQHSDFDAEAECLGEHTKEDYLANREEV